VGVLYLYYLTKKRSGVLLLFLSVKVEKGMQGLIGRVKLFKDLSRSDPFPQKERELIGVF
jgi:hypothetical protein